MPVSASLCRHRLVFLIRDLGHGGAQRQLVTLASVLAARPEWEVTVVHFYPGAFEAALHSAGVRTCCVGKRHRWDLLGFFGRLLKTLRALRPQVIHGYLHESNLMALVLKPLTGFPKVVWGIRDSKTDADTWGILGKLSFRLNCLLSVYADLVIANSQAGKAYYVKHGYPEEAFAVVPNGIDTGLFTPVRSELKRPSGTTFTLIGRLHPVKDHATFLRALALVPEAKGRIIGEGDASYTAGLKRLEQELNLGDRLAWEPSRQDLAAVYPTLDCAVSTSEHEGFSNVLAEAMACGVPVIASAVGDSAWLIGKEEWTFPAGSPESLAARMRAFIGLNGEARQQLGQRNRERIEQNFTVERMVDRTARYCTPLSNDPAGSAARLPLVLWVTTGLGTGGAEMMLTQLVSQLHGWRHAVISLTEGGKHVAALRAAGAEVLSLNMPAGKPTPQALQKLFSETKRLQPAVLMGWMYHGCLAAQMAGLALDVPVVWNIRQSLYDLTLEKRGSALVIQALVALSRFPRAITYNSRLSAQQHEALGYDWGKTLLLPNGFDLEKWRPLPAEDASPGTPTIGRFGRYTAMKDFPTFLEAAALIVQKQPRVRFALAGTGVDPANTELMATVQRLKLQNHVQLLGERDDLPALTAGLTIAVSSSAFGEGFPNVVGEAMACGIPVVATDIGDTAWVMSGTGRLVPPKEPEKLAAACLEVLALSGHERKAQGMSGRQVMEKHFSLGSVLASFHSLLSQTANNGNTGHVSFSPSAAGGIRLSAES